MLAAEFLSNSNSSARLRAKTHTLQRQNSHDAAAMLAFFPKVEAAVHKQQQLQIAEQLKKQPPPRAPSPQPRRRVGRPPKKRDAEAALADAQAAAVMELPTSKRQRGKYIKWFSSPYINDILREHTRQGRSARKTVAALQKEAPDARYANLSHTTVASWFNADGTLKQQHQLELEEGAAMVPNNGRCSVLLNASGAEERMVAVLLEMRQAGTPLNSHVIRWVMQGVLQQKESWSAVLAQLQLSQSYISRWVRNHPELQFRWRQRTTAASKLPLDWEDQGITMAMRIAAAMHLHKVCAQNTTSSLG